MKSPLAQLSMEFAVDVVRICDGIHNRGPIKNQLIRSACSIGANIHEAKYGYSKDDFIFKLQTALKECNETLYWLELMRNLDSISNETAQTLINTCNRIRFMLIKSLNTSKAHKAEESEIVRPEGSL